MIDLRRLREEPAYRHGIERKRVRAGLLDELRNRDHARFVKHDRRCSFELHPNPPSRPAPVVSMALCGLAHVRTRVERRTVLQLTEQRALAFVDDRRHDDLRDGVQVTRRAVRP